jgi:hypothetical protein
MLLLPTPTNGHPHTLMRVPLSGATYTVRWLWNERDAAWTFSMWDPDGVAVVMGVRVLLAVDLLAAAPRSDRRPPHRIVVVDPSGAGTEPTLNSLGARVKIVYTEPTP